MSDERKVGAGQVYDATAAKGSPATIDRITVKRVYRGTARVTCEVLFCDQYPRRVGKKTTKTMRVDQLMSPFYVLLTPCTVPGL